MKMWPGALITVVVVGGAAVLAATMSGDEPEEPAPRWTAPRGYSVVESVPVEGGSQIRLWVDLDAPQQCYLVEEADAAGEHRSGSSSPCSSPEPAWSWDRGQGVIVLHVPSDRADWAAVRGPGGREVGPLVVHGRLVMLRDLWEQRDVRLTVEAWRTTRGDLAAPESLLVTG